MYSEEVKAFRDRCIQCLPNIETIIKKHDTLTEVEKWQKLFNQFQTHKRQKLTRPFLIYLVSNTLGNTFEKINAQLQNQNPGRKVKKELAQEAKPPAQKYSKKRRKEETDDKENQDPNRRCVVYTTTPSSGLQTHCEEKNIPLTQGLEDASPHKDYPNISIKRTPRGKTKVRLFHSHTTTNQNAPHQSEVVSCYTPFTPESKKPGEGRLVFSLDEDIETKLPNLTVERIEPTEFEITLDNIEKSIIRRMGQNQLAHATSREVFVAHGVETIVLVRGSKYHWSHLRALWLGGQHTPKHLLPTTAAANYNTLNLVERFIVEKLTEERKYPVQKIKVKVVPVYGNDKSIIPKLLTFELKWEEKKSDLTILEKTETIIINARSYQQVTTKMRQTVDFIRKQDSFTAKEATSSVETGEKKESLAEEGLPIKKKSKVACTTAPVHTEVIDGETIESSSAPFPK
ncbi:hypothetical protein ACNVED_01750 [Legionella sp. D16C41]|uniref:hypothetical protein n=1 Tax=Legionella sp. D16C41 TaxID=3402688 RepID=UPI003AF4F321